jgi:octaheme c-type cytochrome (tetrathionate reductase family)
MNNIDCLVCHDTTGTYVKGMKNGGLPAPEVDLKYVAENVGYTSRNTCGNCHFYGGGGDAVKNPTMNSCLRYPDRMCDVHMGGYDFSCTDCHRTENHKISGGSTSCPVIEAELSCAGCHTETPHYENDLLDSHLNEHCRHIACNTCHSPLYAKKQPTKVWWDWSKAGDKERRAKKDRYGKTDYHWKKGEQRFEMAARPSYVWSNGNMKRYLIGDPIKMDDGVLKLNEPLGCQKDPNSKITPFQIMGGIQPADAENNYLIVPHLFPWDKNDTSAFWKGLDWEQAFEKGMQAAGLPYSGSYEWIRTDLFRGVQHEVMPKEQALSCVHCHQSLQGDMTCNRCHADSRQADFKELVRQGIDFQAMADNGCDVRDLVGITDYVEFEKLGYDGDPILTGGRFKQLPLALGSGTE